MTFAESIEKTLTDIEDIVSSVRKIQDKKTDIEKNKDGITKLFEKKSMEIWNSLIDFLLKNQLQHLEKHQNGLEFSIDAQYLMQQYEKMKPDQKVVKDAEQHMKELKTQMEKKWGGSIKDKSDEHQTLEFVAKLCG